MRDKTEAELQTEALQSIARELTRANEIKLFELQSRTWTLVRSHGGGASKTTLEYLDEITRL